MAVMKGILDVVTILPDSIGWKQNLGPEGLQERMLENLGWLYNFQMTNYTFIDKKMKWIN